MPSNLMSLGAVVLEGGGVEQRGNELCFAPFFGSFCLNSYVKRSINVRMYVEDTKCD